MSETITLTGGVVTSGQTATGGSGALSMDPVIEGTISETMTIKRKVVEEYELASDAVMTVSFAGLTNAHFIMIKATGKVRARVTSADGATQSIPVDGVLILICSTVPVTALDLMRVSGAVTCYARVLLAEKNT